MNFKESFQFLNEHPAFCGDFKGCLDIIPLNVCKNGWCLEGLEKEQITLYRQDKDFSLYWDKASEDDKNSHSVEVDYETYYGYPYKIERTAIWLEAGHRRKFFTSGESHRFNLYNFQNWCDFEIHVKSANSFEEGIVELAKKVKERYGDFSHESMTPEWINENNRKIDFMSCFHPIENSDNKEYIPDPNYIYISEYDVNEIWWQTFFLPRYPKFDYPEMKDSIVCIDKFMSRENWEKYLKMEGLNSTNGNIN